MENEINNQKEQLKNSRFTLNFIILTTTFFSLTFLIVGFFVGRTVNIKDKIATGDTTTIFQKNTYSPKSDVDFTLFWDVWDLMEKNYVDKDKLDNQKMLYGAINGMLQSAGDQHTFFLSEDDLKSLQEGLEGSFQGIGAELGVKDDVITIIAPLKDSPAMKAGLLSGDKIIKIDGEKTDNLTIDKAVEKIRGKKGTDVILTIFREGDTDFKDITVTRDDIKVSSVELSFVDNVARIELKHFGDKTVSELDDAIIKIQNSDAKAVILDLRGNPGGYLETAVEVSSRFLDKNSLVVSEKDSVQNEKKRYSEGYAPLLNIPVIVLINEGSASASEIVAGALRDNRSDVVLVGEKSFGKGSVQRLFSTAHNTAAKITIEKWFTPNGDQIHEKGIEPGVKVERTYDDYMNNRDPQLDKAVEIAKEKIRGGNFAVNK